jgi:hypothetical protein
MRSIVAAVEDAQQRGEAVSLVEELRSGGRNVGMTHQERVEYVTALMEVEDQRRTARAHRMVNQILEGLGGVEGFGTVAADSSSPGPREIGLAQAVAEQQRAE